MSHSIELLLSDFCQIFVKIFLKASYSMIITYLQVIGRSICRGVIAVTADDTLM